MSEKKISLVPVDDDNWRDIAVLEVKKEQSEYVASGSYYLCLCNYDGLWNPLAIQLDDQVIGFMMWAIDEDDNSCWLGGITIDQKFQGKGFGKASVKEAVEKLSSEHSYKNFALSYNPENKGARHVYASLGFEEHDEMEDEEVVARLQLS
jgi:diamine N-acetyltransferase